MLINRTGAMVLPFFSIYLNQELNFDLSSCAIIMACYGMGSVLGAVAGGILTDKIGFYKVMLGSLTATGFAFILIIFLKSFYLLCAGIFLASLVADTFRPANLTAIEAFSKKDNLTRSFGLVRLAVNLGYAIGPSLGGVIAFRLGYNYLFIINGFSVLAAAFVFFMFFKNQQSVEIRNVENAHPEIEKTVGNQKLPWKDGPYLMYLLLFTLVIVVFFLVLYIVPLFYKVEYGFDENLVGILLALNGVIIVLFEMPLIYIVEKHFNQQVLVTFGGFLIGLSVFSFVFISSPILAAIIFMSLITIGEMLSFPFSNSFALSFASARNRGKYMGLYTMTFSVAHIAAPIFWFNYVDTQGYNNTWIFAGVLAISASLLIIMTKWLRTKNANSPSTVTQAISTKVSK